MAEENKILPNKLNPDESEIEMQTEAQIALKAQQNQELRSIEMEIRELENKMKQRQIPFTSLLERNQFDELDIRDDPNVSHEQKVFDLEERLRSTKLTYEEGIRMKTIENNASMNQDSSNAPLRNFIYNEFMNKESGKPNNSSNKFGELGVLANHAPESVLDEQTQISLVNKILGNNPQIVRTAQCHNHVIGHGGVERTLTKLSQLVPKELHWHNMRKDVCTFRRQCPCCIFMQPSKRLISTSAPYNMSVSYPNDRVNIDTVGPLPPDGEGNTHIIAIMDVFSRFIELYPVNGPTAYNAFRALTNWCGRYGIPNETLSDNGPEYVNHIISELTVVFFQ